MGQTTLGFVGDVMLGRLVGKEMKDRKPEAFWGSAAPVLRSADVVFANLECAITSSRKQWERTHKIFHFGAPPRAIDVLMAGNIGCVSLANNHILDFEIQGLRDTIRFLDKAGINHAGAGPSLDAARAPAYVDLKEITVSFTAITDNEPAFAATDQDPGAFFVNVGDRGIWDDILTAAAARAKAMTPDVAILSAHLGPNMVDVPSQLFRDFADAAIDHGFDIFHGHSAHAFQGVRTRNGKLILHDTGDFLDDYAVDPALRNDWSFIFLVDIENSQLKGLRMIPVKLSFAQVDIATGAFADAIAQKMIDRCRPLGVTPQRTPEGLYLGVS